MNKRDLEKKLKRYEEGLQRMEEIIRLTLTPEEEEKLKKIEVNK